LISSTICAKCSFLIKESNRCFASRLEKWQSLGLVREDENGRPLVEGICNLYNQEAGDLEENLIKRKRDIGITVSFFVIHRGTDTSELIKTLQSILDSDISETTELKIVSMNSDPFLEISPLLSGKISHSLVVRADMDEDPNFILTNAMKKMKNSFVVVVEAGQVVYNTIRGDVNHLINEDLKVVSLLHQKDGDFYGCMLFLAKHVEYYAFDDLFVKLYHLAANEITYI
jgi:hypothetical protein